MVVNVGGNNIGHSGGTFQKVIGNQVITFKMVPIVCPPIEKDGTLNLDELDANAVVLQNVGGVLAVLDDGWTMMAGGAGNFALGAHNDHHKIGGKIRVKFNKDCTIENICYPDCRIEVVKFVAKICKCEPCEQFLKNN